MSRVLWNPLSSHDIPRIGARVQGRERDVVLGLILQMTGIGTPLLYYGDEVGLVGNGAHGGQDPDNRETFPWERERWSSRLLAVTRRLVELRRSQPALVDGGYETLAAAEGHGVYAYARSSSDAGGQVVIVLSGDDAQRSEVSVPVFWASVPDGAVLRDALADLSPEPVQARYVVRGGSIVLPKLPARSGMVLVRE